MNASGARTGPGRKSTKGPAPYIYKPQHQRYDISQHTKTSGLAKPILLILLRVCFEFACFMGFYWFLITR